MPVYEANKEEGESHDIPDDERIVSQTTVNGIERIETEKKPRYVCEECGDEFLEKRALYGHKSAHS